MISVYTVAEAAAMNTIDAKPLIDPAGPTITGVNMSPGNNNNNNTVSAAADSSDTQVKSNLTVSAESGSPEHRNTGTFATAAESGQYEQHHAAHFPLQQQSVDGGPVIADLGNYFMPNQPTAYSNAYEGYYHAAPISDMNGIAGGFMNSATQQQPHQQQLHHRFHPYNNGVSSMRTEVSSSALHNEQQQQQLHQQPASQQTPSPSPIQCEKCSFYCETSNEMHMHYIDEHGGDHAATNAVNVKTESDHNAVIEYIDNTQQQQTTSSKEVADAPAADILDLDSQKMVYGQQQQQPQHGPLPPMHSLHPMHSRGMLWSHHDSYASVYPSQQQQQQLSNQPTQTNQQLTQQNNQQIQQQQHQHQQQHAQQHGIHHHHHQQQQQSMQMNNHVMHHQQHSIMAHHSPIHLQNHQHQLHIKDEFGIQPKTTHISPNNNGLIPPKDVTSNNLHSSSPSEFPSTTTPQHENSAVATSFRNSATSGIVGNGSNSLILPSHHQQTATDPPANGCMSGSTFEAATSSSLPTPPVVAKSGTWKSNEARRPKTYNCTACNKWFTSSGHLKRHYNTTLHKNAVKSSGIVDPATKPTSMFHHPDRDQNKLHKVNHNHVPPVIQPPLQPQAPSSNASSSDGASDNANDFTPYTPTLGFPPHHQHISQTSHQHPQHNLHVFRTQSIENNHHHEQLQQPQQQQSLNTNNITHHSVHPNGQAGPSVQISQSRGLQFTMTNTTGTNNNINSASNNHICSSTNESNHQQQPMPPPMDNLQHLATKESICSTLNATETYHHTVPIKLELPSHQQLQTRSTEYDNMLQPQQQQQPQPFNTITNNTTISTNINNNMSIITNQCPAFTTQPLISSTPTTITNTALLQSPLQQQQPAHWQLDMEAAPQQPSYHHHTNITESSLLPTITTIMPVSTHQQQQSPSLQQHNPNMHLYTTTPIIISNTEDLSQQQLQPLVLPSIRSITGNHHHYLDRSDSIADGPVTANIHDDCGQSSRMPDGTHMLMQEKPKQADLITLIDLDQKSTLKQQQQQSHEQQQSPYNSAERPSADINDDTIDSTTLTLSTDYQSVTKPDESIDGGAEESTPFNTPPHTPSVVLIASTASTANANRNDRKARKPYQRRPKPASLDGGTQTAAASTESAATPNGTNMTTKQRPIKSATSNAARNAGIATNGNVDRSEVCAPCKKTFNRLCYLTQHNQSFHSGARPYKCATCGKRFACHDACVAHSAKHNGNKPFKCEQCPKQFNHKTDLRRHMCLHQNLKPHTCEECGKSFVRRDHKVKHVQTHARRAAIAAEKENRLAEARSSSGGREAGRGISASTGEDANSTDSSDVTKTTVSQFGIHNNCENSNDDTDDDNENDVLTDKSFTNPKFPESIRPNLARI